MSYVQVPPDSTGKKIATVENGAGEQVQVVSVEGVATESTLANINTHFKAYAEGHSASDKGLPALVLRDDTQYGLISTDNTGAVKTQLPTDAATETTLAAILSLQDQVKSLADGIQYLANAISASMPRLDVANRQAVNVETGAVTVSGSLTTVSSVTTVASVTNLATIGGVNAIYAQQDIPFAIYDNIKVS